MFHNRINNILSLAKIFKALYQICIKKSKDIKRIKMALHPVVTVIKINT